MIRFRTFFILIYGIANAGLILYGLLALSNPDILMKSFSSYVYQFPSDAKAAVAYLSALYRLLGFLNLLLGSAGILLLSRYRINRQSWLLHGIISISILSYVGPIIFDNTVGHIGVVEIVEHVIFAMMTVFGIAMLGNRKVNEQH